MISPLIAELLQAHLAQTEIFRTGYPDGKKWHGFTILVLQKERNREWFLSIKIAFPDRPSSRPE